MSNEATNPTRSTVPQRGCRGSSATTAGVRVEVMPSYIPEQSDPMGTDTKPPEYVFAYRVRITNQSDHRVKLLSRSWTIVDADGVLRDVKGLGVIGQQPELDPGTFHEYTSFCPLQTPWGTMEGAYTMRIEAGAEPPLLFDARIARFYLVASDDGE